MFTLGGGAKGKHLPTFEVKGFELFQQLGSNGNFQPLLLYSVSLWVQRNIGKCAPLAL